VAGEGVLFLVIFLSGFLLSRSCAPYSSAILTVHKLITLAALVILGITVRQMNQAASLNALELGAVVVTGLLFLGTIATGGLLSTGKSLPAVVLRVHEVIPYVTTLATAAALVLFFRR
jgi:hypothetical protein